MSAAEGDSPPGELAPEALAERVSALLAQAESAAELAALLARARDAGVELAPEQVVELDRWFVAEWSVRSPLERVEAMLRIATLSDLPLARNVVRGSRAPEAQIAEALSRACAALALADSEEDDDDDSTADEAARDYEPASMRLAREALGVAADASPASVKRAYLRQVKLHRPERDAEGFQRVRAAYERLRTENPARSAEARSRIAPLASAVQTPVVIRPSSDPLAPFFERARSLRRGDAELVRIWTEAVEAVPDSPAARQELYAALAARGQEAEAGEALAAAIRAGHAGFSRLLVTAHPESAPSDLLERAEEQAALGAAVLHAWVVRADYERATRAALRQIDAALASSELDVSLDDCVTTLFGCASAGARGSARELAARIEAYLRHAPRELTASGLAAHWSIAHELAQSSRWLGEEAYRAMGSALLAEDVATGRQTLAALLAKRPKQRRKIARRAPLLASLFEIRAPVEANAVLPVPEREPEPEPEPESKRPPREDPTQFVPAWPFWVFTGVVVILALALVRAIVASKQKTPRAAAPLQVHPLPSPGDDSELDDLDAGALDAGGSRVEVAANALLRYAIARKRPDAANIARAVLEAAKDERCDRMWLQARELLQVQDILAPGADMRLHELCLNLFDEVRASCP